MRRCCGCILNICCSSVPCRSRAILLRRAVTGSWARGYLAITFGLYLQRFLLALHVTQHRPLFHRPGESGSTAVKAPRV